MTRVLGRLFAAAPILCLAACSGDDGPVLDSGVAPASDSGVSVVADSGVVDTPDAGFADSGVVDCTRNPFRCAPMQLMDTQCVCLEACEGDLRWNAVDEVCEAPPAGQCSTDRDCLTGEVCLDTPAGGGLFACAGQQTCRCLRTCDPWVTVAQAGCPPDYDFGGGRQPVACTWIGDEALPVGLCLPEGSGGEQAAVCNMATACNRQKNFVCVGTTSNDSNGACARYCDDARPDNAVCEALGDYTCVGLGNAMVPNVGICGNLPPMDLGTTCTSSVTCTGALCSTVLAGSCSLACGGLSLCGPEALCVSFTGGAPPGEEDLCMVRCSGPDAAGDAECQAKNPNTQCRALIPNAPALCAPPCYAGIGCVTGSCSQTTGRCE